MRDFMKKYLLLILSSTLLSGCLETKNKVNCVDTILDLHVPSNYLEKDFIRIDDTIKLMRYAKPIDIAYYFQESQINLGQKKYTIIVKEGIIKNDNYQLDLLVRKDNDEQGENLLFWLKSYDNNRNQIGHMDFAFFEGRPNPDMYGSIKCDTLIHRVYKKKLDIFRINEIGETIFIESSMIE